MASASLVLDAANAQHLPPSTKLQNALAAYSWVTTLAVEASFDDLGNGYRRYPLSGGDGETGLALVKWEHSLPSVLEVQVDGHVLAPKSTLETLVTLDLDGLGKRAYNAKYKQTHRLQNSVYQREYHRKNPDKEGQRMQRYRRENQARLRETALEYQSKNHDALLAYQRDYYAKNRDVILAKRKARQTGRGKGPNQQGQPGVETRSPGARRRGRP